MYHKKYDNFLKSEGLTFRAANPDQFSVENETSLNLQTNVLQSKKSYSRLSCHITNQEGYSIAYPLQNQSLN